MRSLKIDGAHIHTGAPDEMVELSVLRGDTTERKIDHERTAEFLLSWLKENVASGTMAHLRRKIIEEG
jgi:hypothetical protein